MLKALGLILTLGGAGRERKIKRNTGTFSLYTEFSLFQPPPTSNNNSV
jgi:hypothetical protein